MRENEIGSLVVSQCFSVHRELGPGLLESVYESALAVELASKGLVVERQVLIPVAYKGLVLEQGFRADLVVEKKVLLEIKAVDTINSAHRKQILTYLRFSGCRLGYLLNFGESMMKHGINRFANGMLEL